MLDASFVNVKVVLLPVANKLAASLPSANVAPSGTLISTVKSNAHVSSPPSTDLVTVNAPYVGSSILVFVNFASATTSEEIVPSVPVASTVYSAFSASVTV